MTDMQNEIILSDKQYILSQEKNEMYRLEKGEVEIYIIPYTNGHPGKPEFFCCINEKDKKRAIPSLVYEDIGNVTWYLLIKPRTEEAVLTITEFGSSSIPFRNFLKKGDSDKYETIGFERSLVEYYHRKSKIIVTVTEPFLTDVPDAAYYLEKGEIFIRVVPVVDGKAGNAEHFCEIKDTDEFRIIPSLAYEDGNHEHWALKIETTTEESVLVPLTTTASQSNKEAFLKLGNVMTFAEEGYENSLVEFYKRKKDVPDVVNIVRREKDEKDLSDNIGTAIGNELQENGQTDQTGNAYYQALQFACKRMGISLIKGDELHTRCGKDPKVPDIARASHFICRRVILDAEWYKSDCGAFISTLDKEIVACVPDKNGKYQLFRSSDESSALLTPEIAVQISPQAYSIGRTLPLKSLNKKDVYEFCKKSIKSRDLKPYTVLVIFCSLIGVLLPTLNRMIYDDYIPIGNIGHLTQLCLVMLTFMVGNVSFSIVKNLFGYRITSRVGNELQNAVYHRLFHLPESFFREYDSADLAGRVSGIGGIASRYANTLVISAISALFSIFYLIRMFTYNTKLTWLSLAIYAVYLILIVAITSTVHKGQVRIAEAESESSGKLYQYLNGADKIRMAGVEERALLSYMKPYARQQYEEIRVNRLVSIEEALTTVVKSIFSMVLYWYIVKKVETGNISVGTFVAFNTAFGSFTGALDALLDEALKLFAEKNEIKRFWSIFEAVPEDDDSKEVPGPLSGRVSFEHVSFAYSKGSKNVLNDISLDIKPGEYVGIVGPSGCGKSTLLKLLLGFETPETGSVMVDQKDLRAMNKSAYRRQLGVVLQNGNLISGTIYENITITAPEANLARVNEVVQQVGLKDDIAQMPMGLHTMLGENCNTISGGQKQRILIARAICGNPKILIFDEATSALDNLTQAAVSSSLDKMNKTRIVVAHRLSTIKNCDRIIVFDNGEIVQQGTYDTLMDDKNGLFYALASRQIAD